MKKRLDVILVEMGLCPSREQAQRAVMAGLVFADGRQLDKPGQQVEAGLILELRGGQPFVSRGGEKLAGALEDFGLAVDGLICLDLGASTGGFTDCLLQKGAAKVYAVDVGHGQLAWKLRNDPRVSVMEGLNARHLRPEMLPELVMLATVDVSFISLRLVLPVIPAVLAPAGSVVALIKPQFEAGRASVGKGGVVRSSEIHRVVLTRVLEAAAGLGLSLRGLTHSPLRGPQGNIEFFAWWDGSGGAAVPPSELVATVVDRAHRTFGI